MSVLLAAKSTGRRLRTASLQQWDQDRKSTRLNSSHLVISYAVFCLKKKDLMGNILVVVALGVVVAILLAGLFVMAIGGDVAKKWSNRLMRYRVLAHAIAFLIVLSALDFSSPP